MFLSPGSNAKVEDKMGSEVTYSPADVRITGYKVIDLRFPTSLDGVGSDAMHVGTNGSHPYIQLETNIPGLLGEGIVQPPSVEPELHKLVYADNYLMI